MSAVGSVNRRESNRLEHNYTNGEGESSHVWQSGKKRSYNTVWNGHSTVCKYSHFPFHSSSTWSWDTGGTSALQPIIPGQQAVMWQQIWLSCDNKFVWYPSSCFQVLQHNSIRSEVTQCVVFRPQNLVLFPEVHEMRLTTDLIGQDYKSQVLQCNQERHVMFCLPPLRAPLPPLPHPLPIRPCVTCLLGCFS